MKLVLKFNHFAILYPSTGAVAIICITVNNRLALTANLNVSVKPFNVLENKVLCRQCH